MNIASRIINQSKGPINERVSPKDPAAEPLSADDFIEITDDGVDIAALHPVAVNAGGTGIVRINGRTFAVMRRGDKAKFHDDVRRLKESKNGHTPAAGSAAPTA